MKNILSLTGVAALALSLAACGSAGGSNSTGDQAGSTPSASEKSGENGTQNGSQNGNGTQNGTQTQNGVVPELPVTASTTQICDYLTQLAAASNKAVGLEKTDGAGKTTTETDPANKVKLVLSCLLAPNASAHEHEMTNQQMMALANSKLFIVNGVDLEHFLDKALAASGFKGEIVVSSGQEGAGFGNAAKDLKIFNAPEKVKIAKWPFPGENGEDPEFTHDPHVWTSPENAMIQVKNIAAALEAAAPEAKDALAEGAKGYLNQIQEMDQWAAKSFSSVPEKSRVLFTSHDAFGYFSNHYGLTFMGAALPDFSDLGEASADHLKQTVQKIKESGAKAIFGETSNSDKNVQKLAKEANVKLVSGEYALYGDSLGPAGSDGETYLGATIHNVANLVKAWDGTVAPLPDDLSKYEPKLDNN
ncbi:hypothetical protein BK816_08535 [Boudabousia tangfeifanii]|uniref:Zinc ABC transporter substrate-binding protein n=1 Tax=Boudabousia tangfeifanii TaxID=1912795 RepID=A0A1D9MM49_9ACTO|nr:metal ABC transporter substrate-binding protein [Boudabousia tangfeifanii]AOZ73318.1 hypothetical protein BK816_08535 [Boudabousia tangfeifanii]